MKSYIHINLGLLIIKRVGETHFLSWKTEEHRMLWKSNRKGSFWVLRLKARALASMSSSKSSFSSLTSGESLDPKICLRQKKFIIGWDLYNFIFESPHQNPLWDETWYCGFKKDTINKTDNGSFESKLKKPGYGLSGCWAFTTSILRLLIFLITRFLGQRLEVVEFCLSEHYIIEVSHTHTSMLIVALWLLGLSFRRHGVDIFHTINIFWFMKSGG